MSQEEETFEVYAWVAEPTEASKVTPEQIAEFQSVIGGSLAIERRTDGTLVFYTSDEVTKFRLDALMRMLGLFREQKIYAPTKS